MYSASSDKYLFWKSSIMSAVTCDVILLFPHFHRHALCSLLLGDKVSTHTHTLLAQEARNWRVFEGGNQYLPVISRRKGRQKNKEKNFSDDNFFSPDSNIHKLHNMFWKIYLASRSNLLAEEIFLKLGESLPSSSTPSPLTHANSFVKLNYFKCFNGSWSRRRRRWSCDFVRRCLPSVCHQQLSRGT